MACSFEPILAEDGRHDKNCARLDWWLGIRQLATGENDKHRDPDLSGRGV
jgi:hypothetical protein